MTRPAFELTAFPLDGIRLIEASAGTGKTFSLAGLFLRLLVEQRVDVAEILVMTFTRAATQELRERIRARLERAGRIAADPAEARPGNVEDDLCVTLIDRAVAKGEARTAIARRLRAAAARMDDAAISTIHGFAQAAARENAFDSGLPFDRGTQVDDRAVQRESVADYWRSQVLGRPPGQAQAFVARWPTPKRLEADLAPALTRPHVALWSPPADDLATLSDRAHALWAEEHDALRHLLTDAADNGRLLKSGDLHKALDTAGGVDALLAALDAALAGTAAGIPLLPAWLAELGTDAGVAKHVQKKALAAVRPQDLALVLALAALAPVAQLEAIRHALHAVRQSIRARKRDGRQFSFADMIEALHEAVLDSQRGLALADALHRTWPYALVDEFQDTDPLQYDILRAVYHGRERGALLLIGDPKQAIYGFRGGDVYAYLQAARDAAGGYDLDTNYRSTQPVLDGIAALFLGPAQGTEPGPFLVPGIDFHEVTSGRTDGDVIIEHGGAPLPAVTAWAVGGDGLKTGQGKRLLREATVSEICALLDPANGARVRRADGGDGPVQPNHIAVLVNTNAEAAEVQRALARRGVAAVCLQRATVFQSAEARDLLYLLRAADSAARPETMRAALGTQLIGWRLAELLALDADEARWHAEAARFQNAHETWRTRGVLAMLEPFLQTAAERILALGDGERRMTNYLQLAELLAEAEAETFGFAGLMRWLAEQIEAEDEAAGAENRQLRLESDDALVRIATIHAVKGLQYPIVFVPFTPSMGPSRAPSAPWIFHDADGRAWLDPGVAAGGHQAEASREARAESLRLLYVALTRAEQAVYLGWGVINGAANSPLAWLLHAGDSADVDRVFAGNAKAPAWLNEATIFARLQEWADRARGAVAVKAPPRPLADDFRAAAAAAPDGHARTDLPAPRSEWSVFSFSRLVAGGRARVPGAGADDESADPLPELRPATGAIALQGPAFGTAVHGLLEAVDPAAWPAPDAAVEDAHRSLAAWHLQHAGLPLGSGADRAVLLDNVCRLVARTLHTPLPHIGPLARVPAARRLVEMEFFLALGGERVGRILGLLNDHGYAVTLPPERAARALHGLMQGFIDLTVEADGRYWVVDYKTNRLGERAADYGRDALAHAVRHGSYDLQYLIYLVALHRHLGRALPDYDPARHLGGAQYLFLRGLDGTSADTGVFVDTPDPDFIVALDDLFLGRSAAA
ncbi:MAG: exodeoxyribonuclease V subunit beta [Pseudomonadales bacterium]